jgi:hypothetical protein
VAHHALNLLPLHAGERKQAVVHFQIHLSRAGALRSEQHSASYAGTRLSNDVKPVPEQQVEVAVNASLSSTDS